MCFVILKFGTKRATSLCDTYPSTRLQALRGNAVFGYWQDGCKETMPPRVCDGQGWGVDPTLKNFGSLGLTTENCVMWLPEQSYVGSDNKTKTLVCKDCRPPTVGKPINCLRCRCKVANRTCSLPEAWCSARSTCITASSCSDGAASQELVQCAAYPQHSRRGPACHDGYACRRCSSSGGSRRSSSLYHSICLYFEHLDILRNLSPFLFRSETCDRYRNAYERPVTERGVLEGYLDTPGYGRGEGMVLRQG